jgi:signal transduction histidine kinase
MTQPRKRRRSLRARLVTITMVAATGAVVVLVVGLQLVLAHASTAETRNLLHARADAAAATVRFVNGRTRVLDPPSDSLDQNLWIFDAQDRRIDGNQPANALETAVRDLSAVKSQRKLLVQDRFRLLARPVVRGPGNQVIAVVVAGIDLKPYESSERRELVVSVFLGLVAVLAAGAAAWASASYSLRQVGRMVRSADDWREHDLNGRFDLGHPVDELTELGQTLDRMLDRIAQALHSERRLTDEVAHELRTPLSVIRSEAQLALLHEHEDRATEESLHSIVGATDRMNRAISTMLSVARSAHAGPDLCRVADVLDAACEHAPATSATRLLVDSVPVTLSVAAPETVVVAALAPLLENALRHARSEARLSAHAEEQQVLIEVWDDGPGVAPGLREAIFEPGNSSQETGGGLGLALSRRLAHSIGGEVHERGVGHGLFVLVLPGA